MDSTSLSQGSVKKTAPAIRYGWLRTLLFIICAFILSLIGQIAAVIVFIVIGGIAYAYHKDSVTYTNSKGPDTSLHSQRSEEI
jgi:hypothetical protein